MHHSTIRISIQHLKCNPENITQPADIQADLPQKPGGPWQLHHGTRRQPVPTVAPLACTGIGSFFSSQQVFC
jgi:hypothetical protein